jgi:hypothetical protein
MSKGIHADKEYKTSLEENFLKHIGYEHIENICSEMEAMEGDWKDIDFPGELDQWFLDYKKSEDKRRKKQQRRNPVLRFARKAAIILLFIVGFNYILIANVEAYRLRFLNSFIFIRDKFTQIDIQKDKVVDESNIPKDWSGLYYLSYLPTGYYLDSANSTVSFQQIYYKNSEGNLLTFHQFNAAISQQVDSEDGKVTNIVINEEEAILIEKEDKVIINWIQEEKAFYLEAGNIEIKEMIKMAENIKISE